MADSSVEPTSTLQHERGPPRKRRRLVISCTECHRRKQKCDRDLPCGNCKSRNKESHCTYETTAKASGDDKKQELRSAHSSSDARQNEGDGGALSSFAAALGYSQNGASTLGFLRTLETQDGNGDEAHDMAARTALLQATTRDTLAVRERFKGLIRQLPARTYMDRLISIFLNTFNYQYYAVDPDIFHSQLERWHTLPFKLLTQKGPLALDPDMRVFPAVLFEVIGIALLVVTEESELAKEFSALKYAASMTFEDLAMDYSESGMAIVGLFDKKAMSITTVQAEFLRATFLKFTAQVPDSWHMISIAIKDAQELGMHRDSLDPKPVDSSAEAVLENEWLIQRRRKMYLILSMWDISMSIFLGRPGTINRTYPLPSSPVDTAKPQDRSRTPVTTRDPWHDPPTPVAAGLWLKEINSVLYDIQDLEREGPQPKDFTKVDRIHQQILEIKERTPAIFRVENPDTRWDDDPDMMWLHITRCHFASLYSFNLMVLHRPYIFGRKESRSEALKACLNVLEMAGRMFDGLPPDHWRNYNLFFGSFDALIMLSTIWIIYPFEHPELKQTALDQFQWTMERFSAMTSRNPLARSAQGVLKAVLNKFTKAINSSDGSTVPSTTTPSSSRATTDTPASSIARSGFGDQNMPKVKDAVDISSSKFVSEAAAPPMAMGRGDWGMPSMDSLASMAPMYPTYDLIFNDLNVVDDGTVPLDGIPLATSTDDSMPWHFGGGFGEDTVWQLLNQYEPGTSG